MECKYHYIRGSGVRQLAKENKKQASSEFLSALDRMVYHIVLRACKANGNNIRLAAGVIE